MNTPAAGLGRADGRSAAGSGRAALASPADRLERAPPAARMSGPALSKHSRNSSSASESATIPPAAPSHTRPVAEFEGPDGDVQLEPGNRATVPDSAGTDLARHRLQLMNDLKRPDLGRAGHRSGRKGGLDEVTVAGLRSRLPRTSDTRCHTPGWASACSRRGTCTLPAAQARLRSFRIRSTIITFSALFLADFSSSLRWAAARRPQADRRLVPLMGLDSAVRPRSAAALKRHARRPPFLGQLTLPSLAHRSPRSGSTTQVCNQPPRPASPARNQRRLQPPLRNT